MRPTAEQVAIMLVAMVRRVGGKRGEGSRWRISEKTVRAVGRRASLRGAFLEELEEELAAVGYTLLRLPEGGFGLIETRAFDSWPSVSSRDRLTAEFRALATKNRDAFERLIEAARAEYVPDEDVEEDD